MAYLTKEDLKKSYTASKNNAKVWRQDYSSFERLANNDLMEGLDPNLPEVNDGSLAASLFKLPKRIVDSKLSGTVKALNRDEAWLAELANIIWRNEIIPNANTQAPFIRKWKDAVRKAAIYGSVPLITLFVDDGDKRHADFIVGQPQDVTLEAYKVSDYDSDVMYWDVFYSPLQLDNMIEQATRENKEAAEEAKLAKAEGREPTTNYNKWDVAALKKIRAGKFDDEGREGDDQPQNSQDNDAVQVKGYKFCVAVQRGVDAPYYMYHKATDSTVREWTNPDPTGDTCIHFLYCYQDFINPYGIGIVKLAGGTQNVLDYMRQADVLATQLGLEPPLDVAGDTNETDLDSLVFAQRALWFTGQAKVTPVQISNEVYQQLPDRMAMYKTSLNQLIPTGDTSIASGAGDPQYSKTPAGVKFQGAQLSIDDDDFKDNLYITFAAVAKSMINTHFANMEGTDMLKVSDEEREALRKGGMDFPETEEGEVSNEVEVAWDTVRAEFDFEVDPETDKVKEDADKLEGLSQAAEILATDPNAVIEMQNDGYQLHKGELLKEMISLSTDNDKIITKMNAQEQAETVQDVDPVTGEPIVDDVVPGEELPPVEEETEVPVMTDAEMEKNMRAVMEEYGVDENTALAALAAEHEGFPVEDVMEVLKARAQEMTSVEA